MNLVSEHPGTYYRPGSAMSEEGPTRQGPSRSLWGRWVTMIEGT